VTPVYASHDVTLYHGDNLDVLPTIEAESVDAIVTDPPYGLEFMGKEWDRLGDARAGTARQNIPGGGDIRNSPVYEAGSPAQAFHTQWALAAFRVLKPGGHLLAFGGTRTFHRLACALEDAGFAIRDCLMWLYGRGFPKSLDVSKAIDKAAGVTRGSAITAPATTDARTWQGWGTALKPAWEPIILARKPLGERTVAANVLRYGAGAINVDAGRIAGGIRPKIEKKIGAPDVAGALYGKGLSRGSRQAGTTARPRWPANLILDEETARLLDEQSGELSSGFMRAGTIKNQATSVALGKMNGIVCSHDTIADTGGASRFFYTSKADKQDREGSRHPTVKPVDLMRYLIRLVTPPGGLILDPFAGSGTTLFAARELGFRAIGIEREAESCADAGRRLRQEVLPL
jgi:site-specific DNA-methyltransferase (adenine-specific)